MSEINGEPLVFDPQSTQYQRALTNGHVIVSRSTYEFVVRLTDSDDGHTARVAREGGEYVGKCSCKGFEYHDGPCSHLAAVRIADHRDAIEIAHVDHAISTHECPMCGHSLEDMDL